MKATVNVYVEEKRLALLMLEKGRENMIIEKDPLSTVL